MRMLDSLRVARCTANIDETAETIATAVFPPLWRRVGARLLQMSPAEARGYLAAHGGPAVRAHVEAALVTNPRLGGWAYAPICERATAELFQRAVAETARHQSAAPSRRAA